MTQSHHRGADAWHRSLTLTLALTLALRLRLTLALAHSLPRVWWRWLLNLAAGQVWLHRPPTPTRNPPCAAFASLCLAGALRRASPCRLALPPAFLGRAACCFGAR